MIFQNKKKFYIIGTNPSDFLDCTIQAFKKIEESELLILSKKFNNEFLKFTNNKKIIFQEDLSKKNNDNLWKKIHEFFQENYIISHLIDGDPNIDEDGIEESNFFESKNIKCQIISGVIKVVNHLNINSNLLTNREKNSSSSFFKKLNIKKVSEIIENLHFEKIILFIESRKELKQLSNMIENLTSNKKRSLTIYSEIGTGIKHNVKIIEDPNIPTYIIIENNEKI